jgi:hypothetical protein
MEQNGKWNSLLFEVFLRSKMKELKVFDTREQKSEWHVSKSRAKIHSDVTSHKRELFTFLC